MDTLIAAGEAMMLAHDGQAQIAAALVNEVRRLARGVLARLGRSPPPCPAALTVRCSSIPCARRATPPCEEAAP